MTVFRRRDFPFSAAYILVIMLLVISVEEIIQVLVREVSSCNVK